MTIDNIESFYNYRTIGNKFDLYTSVLSNDTALILLKLRKDLEIHDNHYTFDNEKLIFNNDLPDELSYMRKKQFRIIVGLSKIKTLLEKKSAN